jgi:hypothetical protein
MGVVARLIDRSIDAWFSSHGRLQGGNDNRNVRNLNVKEIPYMYMYMYMYVYNYPPSPRMVHFCPSISG